MKPLFSGALRTATAGLELWSLACVTSAAAQAPVRACSLLSSDQVKALIYRGQRPDPPKEMAVGRDNSGSACSFPEASSS